MSNNVYNLKNIPNMPERIISALAYLTFGTVGMILLLASVIFKTNPKPFVKFNVWQSILLGLIFAFVQLTYNVFSMFFQLLQFIPFIGKLLNSIFQFIVYYLMNYPVFMGFSILATIIICTLIYLTVLSVMGKFPYIPYISNIIKGLLK